jgi:Uma2 family endonuclease
MPTWGHGRIAGRLFAILDAHGYAAVEPRAVIPETADRRGSSPIPDVAFYLAEPPPDNEWMSRPPDIAVEVISPGQSRQEIRAKVDLYRDFGVRSVWVVDPEWETVDVYEGGTRASFAGEETVRSGIVPGLELRPADLFGSA